MSKSRYYFQLLIGILAAMFVIIPVLRWLGIPSPGDTLESIIGEPNTIKIILVSLFGAAIIFFIIRYPYKGNRR